ncbi:MAG: phage tail protein [Methylococcaceae bacterium]
MSNESDILLRHLPEIYHDSEDLRLLLSAFDDVLFGTENNNPENPGLEKIIANIPNLFSPKPGHLLANPFERTPGDFLPWLAEWVALEHLQVMPEEQYRNVIARIVPLYALRGTKKYLEAILELFFPAIKVTINDQELPSMTVGQSRIGKETRLGGDIPFYFFVKVLFPNQSNAHVNLQNDRLLESICTVIDSAKPAYTAYQLECVFEERN